jgi:UDP-N-acetylmuramoyl-tripeptide--D-alanyl-D-alanine ligase
MREILKNFLRILAKLTLARYKPRVVAITGSVGKTSTKEAAAAVLSSRYYVRASMGNYNNEIGVPLTIINEESGERNGLIWFWVFVKAILKLIYTRYPQVLVLELGTDRPGDIKYLTDLIGRIDVAILTDIGISHLEFFAHPQELAKEKLTLIKKLPEDAVAVLNFDNPKIVEGKNLTRAKILGFGVSQQANLMISDFQIIDSENVTGANFKIHFKGHVVPFFLPHALGTPMVYAATAAVATGIALNVNLATASEVLRKFNPPAGRLRLIDGIKHTRIIDDTYNAAPSSTIAALDALKSISSIRKLAALGDMAELGIKTESGHREVAAKIVENQLNTVFLVGPKSKFTQDELEKRKFSGRVFWFENSDQAKMPIQNALVEGDTILVKGSQSVRMEKIVLEIMAEPQHAPLMLVRQTEKWLSNL